MRSCSHSYSTALVLAWAVGCGESASAEPIASSTQCILGGSEASSLAAPGLGRLLKDGIQTCSVTLVSSNWALTAGHCVADQEAEQLLVAFESQAADGGALPALKRPLRQVVLFPGWGTDVGVLIDNDLALLQFDEPLSPDEVAPVVFGSVNSSCSGEFYGWGATTRTQLGSEQLQGVSLRIRPATTCEAHLTALGEPHLAASLLCAGAADGSPGACHGDSGGPLFTVRNGKKRVLGIAVAGGPTCDEFSLFASSKYYSVWVSETIEP